MKHVYYLIVLLLSVQMTIAQGTVTGNVTDDQGVPLPGATVVEVGTSNGTTTDFDGNYSITVGDDASLAVSFVGYQTSTVAVNGQDQINFSLNQANELDEVVVTSLGIKREAKALGYSIQTVGSDEIVNSGSNSALDALVGKAAGVQITRSAGSAGGGSRILIRGVTSMIGNNQPLIVIDGIITNNETLNSG